MFVIETRTDEEIAEKYLKRNKFDLRKALNGTFYNK